ncbi:MAG: DUF4124 domain-containing protein [Burkholderiales bacterium PBB3]|nr:MAG: DUF4124 domain-containing protein [Burkholderiales bacterium PBB3]
MKMLKNLFALGLLCVCTLAAAQWQWLDKDGRKVFSDRAPPPDILEKNILKRPGGKVTPPTAPAAQEGASSTDQTAAASPAVPASAAKGVGVDKELEAKKKQAADAEAAKRKAEEEKIVKAKIENCARAKQAKAGLDSGIRISRVNGAGEREVMDETARAAEAKRIQAIMDTDCK